MTISTTASSVRVTGNGASTTFAYNFPVPVGAPFELIYTDAFGVQTLISTLLYSVSGIGSPAGGTFTYPLSGPAIASGTSLAFLRLLPLQQQTSLENQGAYYPQVVEGGMDWIVMQIQQLQEQLSRCIKCPPGDAASINLLPTAPIRAAKALRFDGGGQPVVV